MQTPQSLDYIQKIAEQYGNRKAATNNDYDEKAEKEKEKQDKKAQVDHRLLFINNFDERVVPIDSEDKVTEVDDEHVKKTDKTRGLNMD